MEKKELFDYSPAVSRQVADDIKDAIVGVGVLTDLLQSLQKISTPVYDKYKPFKELKTGDMFVLRTHTYSKTEPMNAVGRIYNVYDIVAGQFDYVPDYEWIIQLTDNREVTKDGKQSLESNT